MCTLQEYNGPKRSGDAHRHAQRGSALVLSLITVMVIASLGAGLVQLHAAIDRRHEFAIDRRRALYLAEAGLGEAALAVSQGRTGAIGTEAVPASYGGGVFWVESDDLPDDRVILRCTARIATAEFVVRTMIVPNVNPVTRLGLFGSDGVHIGWGTVLDGYHSGRGSFESQVDPALPVTSTGSLALLGSDADIVLSEVIPTPDLSMTSVGGMGGGTGSGGSWDMRVDSGGPDGGADGGPGGGSDGGSGGGAGGGAGSSGGGATSGASSTDMGPPTYVYGQLRPGAASAVRSDGNSIIVGQIDPYEAPPVLPEITLPTPLELLTGDQTISSDQTNIGSDIQTWVAGSLIVQSGATLTLEGPALLRCEALILEPGSGLIFDDALGPIHVYAEAGLNFRRDARVESIADEVASRGTYLFVPGTAAERDRVNLRCEGRFHGAIYAPDDIVRVPSDLRWLGSIVARIVTTAPGTHVTVDRRLAIGGDGLPAVPRQLSWQAVPMGKEVARQLSIDPLFQLALNGVTPTPAATAAIETEVQLQYVDTMGQAANYTGPLASFNPNLASQIIGARWTDPRDASTRAWATPSGSESTGALTGVRSSLRDVRSTILDNTPTMDVATLSDEEATAEVVVATASIDISTAPTAVQRATQRVDASDADMTPEPDVAADNAAADAASLALKAEALLAEAQVLAAGTTDATALNLVAEIQSTSQRARQAADLAAASATDAATTTGAAQEAAAADAADQRAIAEAHTAEAQALFDELDALI